jgi:predicted Zn-dependent protease
MEVMTWVVGDKGYAFVGGRKDTSKVSVAAWIKMFESSVASLRPLKPEESALAKSIVVRVLPPEPSKGYTYAGLAQRNSLGPRTLPTLRLLNGHYASKTEPAKTQRVKVLQ